MLQALIFDVDGTLADTEAAHRAAFNQAFDQEGLDWHWDEALYTQLLDVSGGKMLVEGAQGDPPGEETKRASGKALFVLAVATSIDAAAAGFTLPTIGVGVGVSLAVIGGVTFVLSAAGVWIGRMGSQALGSKAEILGGLVLIGLGVKVLVDHQAFG